MSRSLASGFLGLAGMYFTWRSSKQGRDHADRLTGQRADHERQLAEEAREQERLADAYAKLRIMTERIGAWAQMIKPMMDTDPPRPVSEPPGLDTQTEVEAVISAFGPEGVIVGLIDLERDAATNGHSANVDFGQPYRKLLDLRPAERDARQELADQVAAKLGHRTPIVQPKPSPPDADPSTKRPTPQPTRRSGLRRQRAEINQSGESRG